MRQLSTRLTLITALMGAAVLLSLGEAQAQTTTVLIGQHPATLSHRGQMDTDASSFRTGHPASPTTRAGHANHDHPAVSLARQTLDGEPSPVDANSFIVQPPASTRWIAAPAAAATVALVSR